MLLPVWVTEGSLGGGNGVSCLPTSLALGFFSSFFPLTHLQASEHSSGASPPPHPPHSPWVSSAPFMALTTFYTLMSSKFVSSASTSLRRAQEPHNHASICYHSWEVYEHLKRIYPKQTDSSPLPTCVHSPNPVLRKEHHYCSPPKVYTQSGGIIIIIIAFKMFLNRLLW